MRNKIAKPLSQKAVSDGEPSEKLVFVQLRLPKELADTLRMHGQAANRKLPAEILHRLRTDQTAANVGLYGWLNPERDMLLGQAIGILAGQIEEAAAEADDFGEGLKGSAQFRGRVLAMVGVAAKELLHALGADDDLMSSDNRAHASLFARQMTNVMRLVGRKEPTVRELSPDRAVAAELGKAWGLQPTKNAEPEYRGPTASGPVIGAVDAYGHVHPLENDCDENEGDRKSDSKSNKRRRQPQEKRN